MLDPNLLTYLLNYVTNERREAFENVLAQRSRYLTVVLEDIYQSQNASAVLRTCDCFGVQDVHIIENENEYDINPDVSLGSNKWLNMHRYNQKKQNTADALMALKAKGYRIVATCPHANQTNLEDFNIEAGKFALVFGTELTGVSETVKAHADEFLTIPMHGFTESFNISVSAAICLHQLAERLRKSTIDWKLSPEEAKEIYFEWLKRSIKRSDLIIDRYFEEQ